MRTAMFTTLLLGLALALGVCTAGAALLSYDDFFAGTNGTWLLNDSTNGWGWKGGWDVQNDNTKWLITNYPPLSYQTGTQALMTNGQVAVGGGDWVSSGRRIGVAETWEPANPYDPYRKVVGGFAYVGAEGKTLWMSALVNQKANNNNYMLRLHANSIAWNPGEGSPYTRITIGLNSGTWQLQAADTNNVIYTASTGVSRTLDTTYLMVLRMAFAEAGDVIDLFVNPASIGGAAPAVPNATVTVTNDVYFRSLRFYPHSGADAGYLDEVRIGETYADVTPVPEPALLLALALGMPLLRTRR